MGDRLTPKFEVRLAVEAPRFGLAYRTPHATSQVHLFNMAAELAYSLTTARRVELQAVGGIGITRVTMFTTTLEPYWPMLPAAWLLMPRVGLGLSVMLSPNVFWYSGAHVAALLPPTHLYVEDRRFTLGLPMLLGSTGVGMRF